MKKDKRNIFILLGILFVIFICFCITNKMIENDIFYSIKVGETILKNGIDFKDHFSWIKDLTYTYPHWLFDVFIYKIYDIFDFFGIYIFSFLLFSFLMCLVFVLNIKKKRSIKSSLITSIVIAFFLSYFSSGRAQAVTYIVFLLEIYFIESFLEKNSILSVVGLFILPIIIANTHIAMFYFYFVLFLPYIFEYIIAIILEKKNIKFSSISIKKNNNLKYLLYLLPVMFLTGFISPLGMNVYTYYPKTILGNSTNYIAEHDPITIKKHLSFFVFVFCYFVFILFNKKKISIKDLFLIAGLILMSLLHSRNYSLFLVISSYFLCNVIETIFSYINIRKLSYFIFIFVICLVSYFSVDKFLDNKEYSYVSSKMYPVEAVSYIKKNLMTNDVKLFNDYDYGSYLILHDIPVFFDSRADLYNKEFNSKLSSFFDLAMRIEKFYPYLFEQYRITHALVRVDDIMGIILKNHVNYKEIYNDSNFAIYEKIEY